MCTRFKQQQGGSSVFDIIWLPSQNDIDGSRSKPSHCKPLPLPSYLLLGGAALGNTFSFRTLLNNFTQVTIFKSTSDIFGTWLAQRKMRTRPTRLYCSILCNSCIFGLLQRDCLTRRSCWLVEKMTDDVCFFKEMDASSVTQCSEAM